jgi:hypothetical protein
MAFLAQRVQEEYNDPGMLEVVRVAASMAKDGSIPHYVGARGRRSEFLKRCEKVLAKVNAHAEKDILKLPKDVQYKIRLLVSDGEEVYDGCLNSGCLGKKTSWIERFRLRVRCKKLGQTYELPRCSHCNLPQAYGRSWGPKDGQDTDLNDMTTKRRGISSSRSLIHSQLLSLRAAAAANCRNIHYASDSD